MDLQPERAGTAKTDRAPEPLKRDQWLRSVEGKVDGVAHAERRERLPGRGLGHALRETIERMGRAVGCLGAAVREPIEERGPTRADDDRRARAREQAVERQRRDGSARGIECGPAERRDDVQSPAAERALERREDRRFAVRRRRAAPSSTTSAGTGTAS
jgi:hypothetical protein